MPVMKQLRIGSETYDTVGEASVTQVLASGTKIATVTIDGAATDLYAPEGGGSGPEPSSTTPAMDGTAAAGTSTDYARADHVHPTDTSRAAASHAHAIADVTGLQTALDGKQPTLVSGTNIKTINGESILGSGDLTVSGGGGSTLTLYTNDSGLYVDSALATSLLESVDYDYDAAMSVLKNAGKVIVEWADTTASEARYAVICGAYYDTIDETFAVALIRASSIAQMETILCS